MEETDVLVIGAGAAGCFAAIQAGAHFPEAKIVLLEKGIKPLAKVKISGGGRCNVTNAESDPLELSKNYPRGEKFLKKAFYTFSSSHMVDWLLKRGIKTILYPEGCLFPESNDSQTIIDCFLKELNNRDIPLLTNVRVDNISREGERWTVTTSKGVYSTQAIILTTGGQPKISGFSLLEELNLKIIPPVPSLFTFNMPDEPVKELMGIVTENASVKIAGEKWSTSGPLLITHWGMSGPAVLKCSAFGARILQEKNYESMILVNWTGTLKQDEIASELKQYVTSARKVANTPLFGLKSRLWDYLFQKAGIAIERTWQEVGPKQINRLVEILGNDSYKMSGKTTFKEEFVTAGGIDLSEIDVNTMSSKKYRGLFFAGEVMDMDGVTGGYNFQAAWTTAFIAGKSVLLK